MRHLTFEERDLKKLFIAETKSARFWRLIKRTTKQVAFLAVIFLVLYYLMNFAAFNKRISYQVNAKSQATTDTPTPVSTSTDNSGVIKPNYSPEIIINKIGVDAPIIFDIAPDLIHDQLANGVVQYQDTAAPGQIGNVVIVGHSSDYAWSAGHYKTIFALLDKLNPGDTIQIPYQDQVFTYTVTSSEVVKPTDLSVLRKSADPQLTLVTCYPVGTTRSRLIIHAALTGGTPTTTQVREPAIIDSLPSSR